MQYLVNATNGLPAIVGTRVATAALDIRTSSGPDAKTVAEVKKGTVLSVTGAVQNGRAQIIYKSKVRWVTAKYLTNSHGFQPELQGRRMRYATPRSTSARRTRTPTPSSPRCRAARSWTSR